MNQLDVINELKRRLDTADRETVIAKERAQAAETEAAALRGADAHAKSLSEQMPRLEQSLQAAREREIRNLATIRRLEDVLSRQKASYEAELEDAEEARVAAEAKMEHYGADAMRYKHDLGLLEDEHKAACAELEYLREIKAAAIEDLKTRDALRSALE